MLLLSPCCACGCLCFSTTGGCVVLIQRFGSSSLLCDVCVYAIQTEQSIFNQKQEIKLMIVNILQNLSHKYCSHNRQITTKDLIGK